MGRNRIPKRFRDTGSAGSASANGIGEALGFSASAIPNAPASTFREIKGAVSRFETQLGVDLARGNIGFADLSERGALGVHFGVGDERTVYLDQAFFDRSIQEINADLKKASDSGFLVATKKPIAAVMTHELAHSVWVDRIEGSNDSKRLKALEKEVRTLYRQHNKQIATTGSFPISRYASTNINEFVAEGVTKGLIGTTQNKYSRRLVALFKEYRDILDSK